MQKEVDVPIKIRNFYNGSIINQDSINGDAALSAAYAGMQGEIDLKLKELADRNDGKRYYLDVTNNTSAAATVTYSENTSQPY
jgi:hypothetical protein